MNVLHMKYTVEIARTGSINKASEALLVAQPNLSRAVKELEGSLGIIIFDRSSKGMTLTADGENFVRYAQKILNQIHTWEPRRPRYNGAKGIYEASRDVLAAIPGVTLVEMERIKEYAWCCGAGSAVNVTNPELSKWTASERITEANATGAEVLVTACPWCESNFVGTADENGQTIKVMDIIDLVKEAL